MNVRQLLENILRLTAPHLDQGTADNDALRRQLATFSAMPDAQRDFIGALAAYGALHAGVGAAGATADLGVRLSALEAKLDTVSARLDAVAEMLDTLVELVLNERASDTVEAPDAA